MRQVNIHAAKTHLSRLVDEAVAGEEVVIARNGKPIVRRAAARRPRSRVRGRGRLRLLLDTHVLLWWLDGDSLRADAQAAIADPDNAVSVSAATIWEISAKHALGRLRVPPDFVEQVAATRFARLAITDAHGWKAGQLPRHHRDPFDRILVAQAQAEGLTIVTRDAALSEYDVAVLAA